VLIVLGAMCGPAALADGTRPPPCGYDTELYIAPKCGIFDTPSRPLGMNDAGVVVGYQDGCPNPSKRRAFIWWLDGTVEVLNIPWSDSSRAVDINNHNQVLLVIRSQVPGQAFVPAIWENGQITAIFSYPEWANDSDAFSINDDGVIVGEFGNTITGPYPQLATWSVKDGLIDLSGYVTPPARLKPRAMNNAEQICGHRLPGYVPPPGEDHKRAFIVSDDTLTLLEKIPTGVNSFARSISEAGHVVGYGDTGVFDPFQRPIVYYPRNAFLWFEGSMEVLPPLPLLAHNQTEAWCVNSWGLVGGESKAIADLDVPIAAPQAVLWHEGKPYNLSELANTPANTKLYMSRAITDGGIIAGEAKKQVGRAARLWPRPPLLGDLDDTCTVDGLDVALLLQAWGEVSTDSPGLVKRADLDGNGAVDAADLGILLAGWTG
jgi:uncharacterized membrane protein